MMSTGNFDLFGMLMSLVNVIIVPFWIPIILICGIIFCILVINKLVGTVSNSDIDHLPSEDEIYTDEI